MFIALLLLWCFSAEIDAHGRLLNPPARSSAWRENPKAFPAFYNDVEMYCGGYSVQWNQNSGRCGICGENYAGRKEFEKGGSLYRGLSVRTYKQGQTIDVYVELTANHLGWFEFRLCNVDGSRSDATQACLDRTVLKDVNGVSKIPIAGNVVHFRTRLVLPSNLKCNKCVFQWKYITGNSWGVDPATNRGCLGCGPTQEQFYGCADVTITSDGSSVKDEVFTQGSTRRPIVTTNSIQTTRQQQDKTTRSSNTGDKCPNGDGHYPDTSSGCKRYYVCSNTGSSWEQKHFFDCPSGTLFSSTLNVCDHASNVRC